MKNLSFVSLLITFTLSAFAQSNQGDNSLVPYRSGDKWGYANETGTVVIAPKYAEADWFNYGMAAVKVGAKWGYINTTGKLVIPARYTVAKGFRKGFMPNSNSTGGDSLLFAGVSLRSDGYEVCINNKGMQLKGCPAIPENSVAENRLPVKEVFVQKNYSLPANDSLFDKILDDFKVPENAETFYIAQKGNKFGVFNSKFETVIPFDYDSIRVADRQRGFVELSKNGNTGLSTGTGNTILPMNYSYIEPVYTKDGKEYVIVKKSGLAFLKDMKDADVISRSYYDISYDPLYDGFILTGDQNLKGYYFLTNKVIEPKYRAIEILPGGQYIKVKTLDGKEGVINLSGKEYFIQ